MQSPEKSIAKDGLLSKTGGVDKCAKRGRRSNS